MTPGRHSGHARRPTIAWGAALVCWVAFIWGHSLVPGPQSTGESDAVAALLSTVLPFVGDLDPDVVTLVIRKGAHLSEYAVLGVLLCGLVLSRRRVRLAPLVVLAALVALVPFVDEGIQLHVPGRSGQLSDVLIDLTGMALGFSVFLLAARLRRGGGAAVRP